MYKNPNKFVQIELWKDCSIGCKFCCNKGQPKSLKKDCLLEALNILDEPSMIEFNEIGFIGGEFFNGEISSTEIKQLFYKLFKKVFNMHFDKIYITAALIYDLNLNLIPFLNFCQTFNIISKIILCTSFDTKYRFKSLNDINLWKNNMKLLKKQFPELRLHTEIILTEAYMQSVLKNEFNILNFEKEFQTSIDYIEPSSGLYYYDKKECAKELLDFFPYKKTFLQFLKKTTIENNLINIDTFLSMELRSNRLYYIVNNQRLMVDNRRLGDGKCELPNFKNKYETGFIDSDESMIDVVNNFKELVGL